jgi:hypothetical protein
MTPATSHAPLLAPVFVVRLRPQYGDGIRGLRQFLKAAWRLYGLRCTGVSTEEFKFHDPRPGRKTRGHSHFGTHEEQESPMEKSNLEKLKQYAATTRSPLAFGGCTYIQWDWKVGKYLGGKNKTDITGKRLVADVSNVMVGFRHLAQGQKPAYALTRLLDPTVDQIERSELGQTDESQWIDGKDPWVPCTAMPFYDEETRQVFILIAAYGERSETGSLIHAFADHNEARPEATEQLPIVQLCVREYVKNDGNPGYAMQLDITGWTERSAAVLRITPPPLAIVDAPKTAAGTDVKPAAVTTDSSDKPTATAKPKRKVSVPGVPDMDLDIPF